jgi:hypothetical protein
VAGVIVKAIGNALTWMFEKYKKDLQIKESNTFAARYR